MNALVKVLKIGVLIITLLFGNITLHAWNDAGHMLISVTAFDLLPAKTQRRYANILQEHPRFKEDFLDLKASAFGATELANENAWLFAMASTWPDLARHFGHVKDSKERDRLVSKYHRGSWHYVNNPVYLKSEDEARLKIPTPVLNMKVRPKLQEMNIVQALIFVEKKISTSHLSDGKKAVYLCWWLHLMGDLHQPLHNVSLYAKKRLSKGDKGGNEIKVGKKRNLHQVWDGSIAASVSEWPELEINVSAEQEQNLYAQDGTSNYAGLSLESAALAASNVYTQGVRNALMKKKKLPEPLPKHIAARTSLSQAQAGLAAQRMAKLLDNFHR